MKIALVLCPSWTIESPSYTLGVLSSNLRRNGHRVKCFDFNIDIYRNCKDQKEIDTWQMDEKGAVWYEEEHILNFMQKHYKYIESLIDGMLSCNPDVIGFTVYSTSRHFSYELAMRIKEKDNKIIIVFGGPQCFRNCEGMDTLKRPYIDAVCLGEGDIALPKMLSIIAKNKGAIGRCAGFGIRDKAGNIIDCGDEKLLDDLSMIPYADYSDFDINKYTKRLLPIATSRGCLGRCEFCNESPHWKRYRFRTAENIYNEIRFQLDKYPEIKEFWFNDSLINGNIRMLNELCDLLIKNKLNIRYGGQALTRQEMEGELLKKMKESGCILISYGLESGSNTVLKKMRKNYNIDTAEKVIRDTHRAGIDVIFNIIVGFPGETEKEIEETMYFTERNLDYAKEISIMPLLLLKGSYIYENAENIGIDLNTKQDQLHWKMLDNSNNYEIRMDRFKLLKNVVGGKAYATCTEENELQDPEEPFLPNLCIELSSLCNLKCYMCPHRYHAEVHGDGCKNGFMNMRIWDNILKNLEKQTKLIESITLYWLGESLLHPKFKIMLSWLLEINMRKNAFSNFFINTNGVYFDHDVSNILLDYASFIENNEKYKGRYLNIHFSIETLNPETYRRIKGSNEPKVLDTILENIDFLVKERFRRKLNLPSITFGSVILEDNADEAELFYKYWDGYLKKYNRECKMIFNTQYFNNKDAVYFRRLEGSFNDEHWQIAVKKYAEIAAKFENEAEKNNPEIKTIETAQKRMPCFQLWNMFMIATDGKVTPCCKDRLLELMIGDLNKEGLSDILYGDKIQEMRMDHIHGKFYKYKVCDECKDPPGGFLSGEDIKIYLQNNRDIKKKTHKPLNICLVSREYPVETGWGGIGTYTYNLAQGLAERGHNVHVISQSLNGGQYYMDGKVNIHRINHKNFFFHNSPFREFSLRLEYSMSVYLKLKEIIKKYKINVVEAPNLSAEAFIFGLSKKIPLVTRLHTHFSEAINFYGLQRNLDSKLSCLLEDAAIRRSDLVTCSTNAHASLVAEEIGMRKDKIKIIPLGIPLPLMNKSKPAGFKNPMVLFVGRLEKRKGVHILAKAIPIVLKEMPDTEFMFIGRDTFISKDYISINGENKHSFKNMVLNMIPEVCLKNIKFLGYVEPEKLSYYFNLCDILVAPSLYESFGLIYIEAMSYGKPVVGCSVGGVPEIINNEINGVLVPPEDSEAIAFAIIDLLKNKDKANKLGLQARKSVEDNFNQKLMVERTEEAYLKLL